MALGTLVLLISTFASGAMTGLVWFVHLVHYPLMAKVGRAGWDTYHLAHTNRTGWLVAPLMIAELATAGWLAASPPPDLDAFSAPALRFGQLALAVAVWVLTFAVSVPLHNRLAAGWDDAVHRRLVTTNLWRSLAWTARFALLLWHLPPH